ncbi:MAG: DUF4178 domain-containing protein [Bryobacteraceae bacterium]
MSQPNAFCPNCGAPVRFLWSSAVQTTCEFCKSILVRSDLDIRKVGEVADLPPDASPIQILTEGNWRGRGFQVIGRIIYEFELGVWNEWHAVFSDGSSGWISDAQASYAISFLQPPQPLPSPSEAYRGAHFNFGGIDFEVTTRTQARYRGVQGELPFQFWDKTQVSFIDMRTRTGQFGTLDYSENPPLLFIGESVPYEELNLKNVREFEGWTLTGQATSGGRY